MIAESVLCTDVKVDVTSDTTEQLLASRTRFFCGRETNTLTGRSECRLQALSPIPGMPPTIAGLGAGKRTIISRTYSEAAIKSKSLDSKSDGECQVSGSQEVSGEATPTLLCHQLVCVSRLQFIQRE
jgi:hypothetical protein